MRSSVTSLLLVAGSIVISLLAVEGLVRIFFPQDRLVTWIEMHDRGFMQNQRGGHFFQERDGRRADYFLDSHGLRTGSAGREDVHGRRVLVLGDSFTFGLLLDNSDTFVTRWEELLRAEPPMRSEAGDINPKKSLEAVDGKGSVGGVGEGREADGGEDSGGGSGLGSDESVRFRLLNAGVGGAGLADWPLWLEEYGAGLMPDVVVYVMNTADIERALSKNLFLLDEESGEVTGSQRWRPRPFFRWLGRTGVYRWIQAHSEGVNRMTTFLWKRVYFEDLTDRFRAESSKVPFPSDVQFDPESGYSKRLSLVLLDKMSRWCAGQGCRFLVTTTGFFEDASGSAEVTGSAEASGSAEAADTSEVVVSTEAADTSEATSRAEGLHTRAVYEALRRGESEVPFYDISSCVASALSRSSRVDAEAEAETGAGAKGGAERGAGQGSLDLIRIPGDSHPNEQGARIMARCLHKEVSQALALGL